MANTYRGTTAEVEVSVVSKDGNVHLSDATTEFKAEFYIKGTYGKEGETVVTVQKDDVFFGDDPDTFVAHVPTDKLKVGRMVCTITGSYQDEHVNPITNQHYRLPFAIGIVSNIDVVEPYI